MTIRSEGLFGVGMFLMGAILAASTYSGISLISMIPVLIVVQIASFGDFVVSIVAVTASKQYGKKSLICSTVFSGINTLLRAIAFTLFLFYLFGATTKPFPMNNGTNMPNEDETRTQFNLPSDEFPTFAPGSERPPRPHGHHGPGGPDRPGHCGPGFPGRHPGGHEGQDPRDDSEQEPREDEQRQREHQGPRRPGHPGRQETNDEHETDTRESDPRTDQARARGYKPSVADIGSPILAWSISIWLFGLNLAIFVLSIVHTRRVMLQGNTSANTTTVNGKVYSELSSKV